MNQLYGELLTFFTEHLDLIQDEYYNILASWTLSTYQHEKLVECTYLLFQGLHGSGKTRALKCLAAISHKPVNTAYTSPATIYRILEQEGYVTLFLDELDTYKRDKRDMMFGILNSGYERGSLVALPDPNDRNKVKYYPVFGPKAIACIKGVQQAFQSRCIEIPMMRNIQPIKFRVDKQQAQQLKQSLEQWRQETLEHSLPETHSQLLNHNNIHDYRLTQIIAPLLQVTPENHKQPIITLTRDLDEQRSQDEATGYYAELYQTLETLWRQHKPQDNVAKLTIEEIKRGYQERTGNPDTENRMIGGMLTTMGLTRKYRETTGRYGRVVTRAQLDRLARRYTRGQIRLA